MSPSPSILDTLSQMFSQSLQVLSRPSVATFEELENKGTLREALIYVLVAAVVTGLLGTGSSATGFLSSVIGTLAGFLVFTYLVYYVGQNQGGSGSLDQVAYTFALFWAPINVIFSALGFLLVITVLGILLLPLLALAALAVNAYFAYLAVQSSMNLRERGKIWLTLVAAFLGALVVSLLTAALLR
ncbi:MAG: YIP1 family protein [Meiothermus sp.]|nr:YIP1 family protein [Meiothermus sp.]